MKSGVLDRGDNTFQGRIRGVRASSQENHVRRANRIEEHEDGGRKGGWWGYQDEVKESCIVSDQVARIKPTQADR